MRQRRRHPGEECDDGDRVDGACCDATCHVVTCAVCEACDTTAGCIAKPRTDCRRAPKPKRAFLDVVDKTADARDKLAFHCTKGASTQTSDFGNPTASTGYTLCLFDRAAGKDRLVLRSGIPRGTGWKATGATGFRYKNKAGTANGITAVALKRGGGGKAQASVDGQGANLHLTALPLVAPVTAELDAGAGACFAATFTAPTNSKGEFKAKGQ